MEGLTVAKAMLSAYLHPSRTDDVRQGVLQLLNSLLLRYNEEFDGVVLAYHDIYICNRTAKILPGLSPYLCLKLKANLLLFSPKPGMLLEGKVNKVEKDYIGVIVLGIFNAAIAFEDIREEFCYQDNVDGIPLWESTSSDHVITLGSTIKFAVKRKIHKERKRERRKENIDADGGRVSKKFPADHSHEREHKHKSDHSHEREHKHKSDHSHEKEPKHKSDHSHEREHKHKSDHSHEREHKHKSDHSHEREHKHKSKRKRNDTDAEVKVDGSVSEEFPANHFYERDDNYKSKRKRNNTDSEVNDSHIVNKGFPEDNFHETKYKHKSKRKRIDTDADL